MIRLREAAAREKDATTHVQTRLLKQIGTLLKSQSSLRRKEMRELPRYHCVLKNPRTPPEAQGATNRRLMMMRILRTRSILEPPSTLALRTSGSGPDAAQPNEPAVPKGMEYNGLRPFDSLLSRENHHAPLPEEVRDVDFQPLFGNL